MFQTQHWFWYPGHKGNELLTWKNPKRTTLQKGPSLSQKGYSARSIQDTRKEYQKES